MNPSLGRKRVSSFHSYVEPRFKNIYVKDMKTEWGYLGEKEGDQ